MSLQVCAAGSSSVPCPSRLTPTSLIDDARALVGHAQRELAADAPTRPGDDRHPSVQDPHVRRSAPRRLDGVVPTGRRPRWPSRSASPRRPGSSPTASARPGPRRRPARGPSPTHVSVSPGHTCLANRTLIFRIDSGPSQSLTTRAISPAVSIPCPNTDGFPTCAAIVSSWCIGLKSPLAPA